MRRKGKSRLITFLLVVLIAGISLLAKRLGWIDDDGRFISRSDENTAESTAGRVNEYKVLKGCSLADHRNNDGDSFDVFHNGERHTFRLYFVDAPEKRRHQYNGKRISQQADYFGIGDEDAIRIGKDARDFTLAELRRAPFDVITKWERVYDSERFYAFVQLHDRNGDSTGEFLSEQLVHRGLARIHTKGEDLPDGTHWRDHREYLRDVEAFARRAKRGAWGKELQLRRSRKKRRLPPAVPEEAFGGLKYMNGSIFATLSSDKDVTLWTHFGSNFSLGKFPIWPCGIASYACHSFH